MLQTTIDFLTSQPASFYQAAIAVIVAGGAISYVIQVIKKLLIERDFSYTVRLWPFKKRITITSDHAVMVLLTGLTALASAADYIITNNPNPAGGEITGLASYLFTAAVLAHRFAVSTHYRGFTQFLTDVKAERARRRAAKLSMQNPILADAAPLER